MNGVYVKFYTEENRRHGHQLLHQWLVALSRELDLPGCSVFRAIGGFGHHHALQSALFCELQGDLPVEIVFALSPAQEALLMQRLRDEGVELFYMRMPIEFGLLGQADVP